MHTIKILVAGFFILSALVLLANAWTTTRPLTGLAISIFLGLWAIISVLNLCIGVYRAGHPFSEELPTMAVVFLSPAVVNILAARMIRTLLFQQRLASETETHRAGRPSFIECAE